MLGTRTKQRSMRRLLMATVGLSLIWTGAVAKPHSAPVSDPRDVEIQLLKAQVQTLAAKVDSLEARANASPPPTSAPPPPPPVAAPIIQTSALPSATAGG